MPDAAKKRARSFLADAAAILFLIAAACALYLPYIRAAGVGSDMLSYLRESYEGVMPWGYLESHRPFRTIAWNLVCLVGGYSKTGLHIVAVSLHVICSLLIYAMVRRLVPDSRMIAFAAAALRLTWTAAAIERADDMIIEALFPEMLTLLAAWVWVILETSPSRPRVRWVLRVMMAALVFLAMGMYEQVWANVGLIPIVFLVAGVISWKDPDSRKSLMAWWGAMAGFLLCYFLYFEVYGSTLERPDDPAIYVSIWETMTRVLMVEVWVHLATGVRDFATVPGAWMPPVVSGIFVIVALILTTRDGEIRWSRTRIGRVTLAGFIWLALSYIHIIVGLASVYGDVAAWGSRFFLSTSYPMILSVMAVAILIIREFGAKARKWGPPIVFGMLFFANVTVIVDGWETIAKRQDHAVSIHQALSRAVPSVEPGTVMLVEGDGLIPDVAEFKLMEDVLFTYYFRNLYNVEDFYILFVTRHYPVEERPDAVLVQSELAYPLSREQKPSYYGIGMNQRYFGPMRWKELDDTADPIQWLEVKKGRVLWLRYGQKGFELVEEKSNPERIRWSLDELHKRILEIDDEFVD